MNEYIFKFRYTYFDKVIREKRIIIEADGIAEALEKFRNNTASHCEIIEIKKISGDIESSEGCLFQVYGLSHQFHGLCLCDS